jgi:hypothetical protein
MKDDKIIWKASVMHHPLFGLHYTDFTAIIEDFLPLLKKYNFDVFFNGHEHNQSYANTPNNLTSPIKNKSTRLSIEDSCF